MSDYFNLKYDSLLNSPPNNQDLGSSQSPYSNVYVDNALVVSNTPLGLSDLVTPKISSISYPGNDTAADIAGGQTITGITPAPTYAYSSGEEIVTEEQGAVTVSQVWTLS